MAPSPFPTLGDVPSRFRSKSALTNNGGRDNNDSLSTALDFISPGWRGQRAVPVRNPEQTELGVVVVPIGGPYLAPTKQLTTTPCSSHQRGHWEAVCVSSGRNANECHFLRLEYGGCSLLPPRTT
ncbi:hypothetical protein ZHAS_00007333 [Anopheles sinensis]|uniref:Uncharacterized protein n=1 Tax=Anopheles sinensis TaxID=74873 RepID=A0A084VPQ6_ANOSI|nr:hypothetical protein ZHAS_00007333 [Anopheles sinensis]